MISKAQYTRAISAEMQVLPVQSSTTTTTAADNQTASLNGTASLAKSNGKIDCAKDCPCGVAAIPVPDQWLEVMVTGKFKVWHIIFIIIALVVTLIVVYCCFHRVRIPRTKQEIEADLMRSTLTTKFRDHLQEFPNEPTTFIEALKRVQDLEEKLEKDDEMLSREAGLRKRKGWLKLKGKQQPERGPTGPAGEAGDATTGNDEQDPNSNNDNKTLASVSALARPQAEPINLLGLANVARNASVMLRDQAAAGKPNKLTVAAQKTSDGETGAKDVSVAIDTTSPPTTKDPKPASSRSRPKTRSARHEPNKLGGEQTEPKDVEAGSTKASSESHSRDPSSGKRRKQKPNLSRSKKLARIKSQPTIDGPDTAPAKDTQLHAGKSDLLSVVVAKSDTNKVPTNTSAGATSSAKQSTRGKTKKAKLSEATKTKRSSSRTKTKDADDGNKLKVVVR